MNNEEDISNIYTFNNIQKGNLNTYTLFYVSCYDEYLRVCKTRLNIKGNKSALEDSDL